MVSTFSAIRHSNPLDPSVSQEPRPELHCGFASVPDALLRVSRSPHALNFVAPDGYFLTRYIGPRGSFALVLRHNCHSTPLSLTLLATIGIFFPSIPRFSLSHVPKPLVPGVMGQSRNLQTGENTVSSVSPRPVLPCPETVPLWVTFGTHRNQTAIAQLLTSRLQSCRQHRVG